MLSACVGDADPAGPEGTFSEALAPEADNRDSLGTFDLAAPAMFAAVELRTHATDSGYLATARVAIVDEGGEPVSGVAVYGTFTADVQSDVQARTDASGVVTFESALAGDAEVDFEVELVGYEISGELAYVRPQTLELDDFATFIEDDGIAEGMGTSSGEEQPNLVEDPPVGGGGSGGSGGYPDASSRTADETSTTTTNGGMGTSSGITTDENPDAPSTNGMGTSSGVTSDENPDAPNDSGMGTSSGSTTLN